MRAREFLSEAPLPPYWDKTKFNPNDIKSMVQYARQQADGLPLGIGSSRIAFEIPYKGKPSALKVAMNERGIAQNIEEAKILETPWVQDTGIVVPLIDYDTENKLSPTWIHVALVKEMTDADEKQWFGSLNNFRSWFASKDDRAEILNDLRETWYGHPNIEEKIKTFVQYAKVIEKLGKTFDLKLVDLLRQDNWGMYNNKPVIIDLGFTIDVWLNYYKRPSQ